MDPTGASSSLPNSGNSLRGMLNSILSGQSLSPKVMDALAAKIGASVAAAINQELHTRVGGYSATDVAVLSEAVRQGIIEAERSGKTEATPAPSFTTPTGVVVGHRPKKAPQPGTPPVWSNYSSHYTTSHQRLLDKLGQHLHAKAAQLSAQVRQQHNIPEGGSVTTDEGGNPIIVDSSGNKVVDLSQEAYSNITSAAASSQRIAVGGAIARGMASGGGLSSIIREVEAVLPEAGPFGEAGMGVAALIGAGSKVGSFVASQRAANAQYQGIYGGSNLAGMGQRAQAGLFGLSTFGDLGGAQAEQLFQGVSSLGLQGSLRQNALQLAVEEFNKYGVSIQQSLQLITAAAENGNKQLSGLGDAINYVTQAAVNTGINANVGRQNLVTTIGAVGQTIGGGATGMGVAAAQAAAITNMGITMQGNAGTISQGLNSPQFMMMAAGVSGMGYGQLLAQGPTGIANAQQGALNQIAGPLIAMAAPIVQRHMQDIRSYKGDQRMIQSSGLLDQMINEINAANPSGNFAIGSDTLVNQVLGMQMSQQDAERYIVNLAIGQIVPGAGFNLSQQAQAQQKAQSQTINLSGKAASVAASVGQLNAAGAGRGGPAVWSSINHQMSTLSSSQQNQVYRALSQAGITAGHGVDAAQNAYLSDVLAHGQSSPMLAALVKDPKYKNALFTVADKGGTRTVNLQDLIAHYADQAATGNVEIASGPGAGQNLSTVLGIKGTGKTLQSTSSAARAGQGTNRAGSLQSRNAKEGPVITVSPSPWLQKMLQFSTNSGNVAVNSANANNLPAPQYPTVDNQQGSVYQ